MAAAMRSAAGEVLEVADEFVHAMKALGWEQMPGSAPSAPRRRSSRSRKVAEDESEEEG